MTLASCIYEGTVRHRRSSPTRHEFRQRLFLMYLDLAELPELLRGSWLWSAERPALAWFRRADHFGPPDQDLSDSVRDLIRERTGECPAGPVRLLTNLRYAGFVMNPISLFYCYDNSECLAFVVAEVTNTPWGERHCYVLDVRGRQANRLLRATVPKQMHVSPFLKMDYDYRFSLIDPGRTLAIHIENVPHDRSAVMPVFDAALILKQRPLTGRSLALALVRYPCITAQIYAGIHWQAWRLWRKRVPVVPHQERQPFHPATPHAEECERINTKDDWEDTPHTYTHPRKESI